MTLSRPPPLRFFDPRVKENTNSSIALIAILTNLTGEASQKKRIFIGGLSFSTEEGTLKQAFEKYGKVLEARIMMEHATNKSRGMYNQQI